MINEFWYYFNKNENELKGYIKKILSYPSNYNTLVQYRNYMKNYQVFFTKDYNKIDKETDEKITKLVELITKLLNNWYDEIPPTRSDNPTLYNVV
jgi:DNA phosphorothioation-dependent restriction protein DptG